MEIRIHKAKRRLELWTDAGGASHKKWECKVGLGFAPDGEKHREGDGRTPEGEYYICTKNPKSKFTLFLGISYPGIKDAQYGLANGFIRQEEYDEIMSAITSRKRPPWETQAGGKIGIHGMGNTADWTAGCIALDDEDIRMLWQEVEVGTAVRINP